jgi:hypothetical protein
VQEAYEIAAISVGMKSSNSLKILLDSRSYEEMAWLDSSSNSFLSPSGEKTNPFAFKIPSTVEMLMR